MSKTFTILEIEDSQYIYYFSEVMSNPEYDLSGLKHCVKNFLDWGEGEPARLAGLPTIEHFKYFDTLEIEVGLYMGGNDWYFIAGDFGSFPILHVPEEAETIIHTHPGLKVWGENQLDFLPSIYDFIHGRSLTSRHFVASSLGIVRYYPVKRADVYADKQYIEMYALGKKNIHPWMQDEYLEQMKKYGCQWVVYPWGDISDQEGLMRVLYEG